MGASVHKVTLRPLSTGSPVAAARVTRRSPQELLEEESARQAAQHWFSLLMLFFPRCP